MKVSELIEMLNCEDKDCEIWLEIIKEGENDPMRAKVKGFEKRTGYRHEKPFSALMIKGIDDSIKIEIPVLLVN